MTVVTKGTVWQTSQEILNDKRCRNLWTAIVYCSLALMHIWGKGGGVPSIGHLMKFTHRNFPFYWLGCFFVVGVDRLRLLQLRPANLQWVIWVVGSNPAVFHNKFVFSFKLKRLALEWTYPAWNITELWYKNRKQFFLLCKFHKGKKGLPPMGSNADPCVLRRVAQLLRLHAAFIHCLHFIYAHKFACIRSYKLCHSGNPPGQSCYIYFDLFISW